LPWVPVSRPSVAALSPLFYFTILEVVSLSAVSDHVSREVEVETTVSGMIVRCHFALASSSTNSIA
jgi:hypothetical protein